LESFNSGASGRWRSILLSLVLNGNRLGMQFTDDTFNKILTLSLLLYVMVMYTISYITGKPLDLYNMFVFIAPLLNNTIHLVTRANVVQKTIEADTQKQVAQITANGRVTNGH